MLMDLNVAEDVDFVDCTLLEFLVLSEASDGDDLNCILLLIRVIDCSIDFAVDS